MLSRKIDIGFSAGASGAVPGASRGGREASGTDLGASGVATKLPPRTDTHIPAEFGTIGFVAQSLPRRRCVQFAHNASPSREPPRLRHPWRKLPDRGGSFALAPQALSPERPRPAARCRRLHACPHPPAPPPAATASSAQSLLPRTPPCPRPRRSDATGRFSTSDAPPRTP